MKIESIKVCAGRTFNHPFEDYSNFKFSVGIEATLAESEDAATEIKALQAKAEALAEDHKKNLLRSVHELQELSSMRQEVASLEESLKRGQARLEEIRKTYNLDHSLAIPESFACGDTAR